MTPQNNNTPFLRLLDFLNTTQFLEQNSVDIRFLLLKIKEVLVLDLERDFAQLISIEVFFFFHPLDLPPSTYYDLKS